MFFEQNAMIENIPNLGRQGNKAIILPNRKISYCFLIKKFFGKKHKTLLRVKMNIIPKVIITKPIKIKIWFLNVSNILRSECPKEIIKKHSNELTKSFDAINFKKPLILSLEFLDIKTKYGITTGLQVNPQTPKQLPSPAKKNNEYAIITAYLRCQFHNYFYFFAYSWH